MQSQALFQSPTMWHQSILIGLSFIVLGALCLINWFSLLTPSSVPQRFDSSSNHYWKKWVGGIILWQLGMAVLAELGYFRAFDQPWRALPTVGLSMMVAIYLAGSVRTLDWLHTTRPWAWLALQSFRLPLELLLYSMYQHGVIGQHMTLAGFNADILVGLTAPLAAWFVWRYQARVWIYWFSVLWNSLGLVLLLNILILAVLSAPFPFQYFRQEPANRMVAEFPFVWLPTLFIPLALFAHLVSIRLALRPRQACLSPST
jgi:hypothetical protein